MEHRKGACLALIRSNRSVSLKSVAGIVEPNDGEHDGSARSRADNLRAMPQKGLPRRSEPNCNADGGGTKGHGRDGRVSTELFP